MKVNYKVIMESYEIANRDFLNDCMEIATEAEAQLGTINTKYMTPARTMNTINANSIVTSGNIILKIQTTQPSAQSGKTIIWINPSS